MTLSTADKTELNADLHGVVEGAGDPPDYLASRTALEPVIARLAQDGWIVEAWDTRATFETRKATRPNVTDWETLEIGGVLQLRRSYAVRHTRTPEHQALVERLGEVASGENTYRHVETHVMQIDVGAAIEKYGNRTVDDPISAVAVILPESHTLGARPPVREEDLT